MKKLLLIATLSGLTVLTHAQDKQELAVANATEQLRTAMVDANKSVLESITMDQLSYGHSSGVVDNKKDFVEKIVSGRSDFVSINLTEQNISVSGKTALVRHKLFAKTNDSGKPGEVTLLVLLVWQKTGGKWKLLARQAVKTV